MPRKKEILSKKLRSLQSSDEKILYGEPESEFGTDELTPQQHKYALNLMDKSFKTQNAAYLDAFPNSKGSKSTIAVEASRLKKHPKIQAFLQNQRKLEEKALINDSIATKRYVKQRLKEESEVTPKTTPASRIKALHLLGQTEGMFIEVRHSPSDIPNDTKGILKEINSILDKLEKRNTTPVIQAEIIEESIE